MKDTFTGIYTKMREQGSQKREPSGLTRTARSKNQIIRTMSGSELLEGRKDVYKSEG